VESRLVLKYKPNFTLAPNLRTNPSPSPYPNDPNPTNPNRNLVLTPQIRLNAVTHNQWRKHGTFCCWKSIVNQNFTNWKTLDGWQNNCQTAEMVLRHCIISCEKLILPPTHLKRVLNSCSWDMISEQSIKHCYWPVVQTTVVGHSFSQWAHNNLLILWCHAGCKPYLCCDFALKQFVIIIYLLIKATIKTHKINQVEPDSCPKGSISWQ